MSDQPRTPAVRTPTVRAVSREVADASTPQIRRVVAMVDAMAVRGVADDLIAPIRPRLAQLRPSRPLRFARLLFHPLDPLIVPAAQWRPTHRTIPRTALLPLAQIVEEALGDQAAGVMAAIEGRGTDDGDLLTSLGAIVWPLAGSILPGADPPPIWLETGLGLTAYHNLARKAGALLSQAVPLVALQTSTAKGLLPPDLNAIGAMLRAVLAIAADALPMFVALLLLRLPQAANVLRSVEAANFVPNLRTATDQAAELLLEHFDRPDGMATLVEGAPLAESGNAVARVAAVLDALDTNDAATGRRQQIRTVRRALDAACTARFTAGLECELLAPLRDLPQAPQNTEVIALETAARSLRGLEIEGRTVGNGSTYDRMLAAAAETVKAGPSTTGLDRADRIRLVEILSGPESALAYLAKKPT